MAGANLTISPKTKERYKGQYSGVFFQRFILGLWVIYYSGRDESKQKTDSSLERTSGESCQCPW